MKINFWKLFYFLLILGGLIILIFLFVKQYYFWQNNELTKFFLPPYKSIFYLLNFVLLRQAQPYLISLGLSLVFLGILIFFNLKFKKRFFYQEEPYMAAVFIFLLGWPYCFYYLISVLFFGLLLNLIIFLKYKNKRVSLFYLWFVFGVLIFVLKNILVII